MGIGMAKNLVLLTGAGFSRNWGGLLANEITNQLLSAINKGPQIVKAEYYKQLATETGNYETVLQEFQRLHSADPENAAILECLTYIEEAIRTCFFEMDRLYGGKSAGINNSARYNVEKFISNFDYFFTTNQDLLIERRFINLFSAPFFIGTHKPARNGTVLPGIRGNPSRFRDYDLGLISQQDLKIKVNDEPVDVAKESLGYLPYIKLHGSYDWQTVSGGRLIISGGKKDQQINKSPLLKDYFEFFCETIKRPNTLIVIIGYGFNDTHINGALSDAFNNGGAQVYINHPRGLKSIPSVLIAPLEGKLYGISERTLNETFMDINQAELLFQKLFHANN